MPTNQAFEVGIGDYGDEPLKADDNEDSGKVVRTAPPKISGRGNQNVGDAVKVEESWTDCRSYIQHMKDDLKIKELIPLKILFFFKYASVFVFYQYLPLHLRSLGLDTTEAGANNALFSLISIFGPPAAGIISDRIGNFKRFLAGITFVNAPLALALLLVPKARETIHFPDQMTFSFGCSTISTSISTLLPFTLQSLDSSICSINLLNNQNFSSSILQCGTVCHTNSTSSSEFAVLKRIPILDENSYRLPDEKSVFTPFATKKPHLNCSKGNSCSLQFTEVGRNQTLEETLVDIKLRNFRYAPKLFDNDVVVSNSEFVIDGKFLFDNNWLDSDTTCTVESAAQAHQFVTPSCENKCILQLNRTLFCSNKDELKVHDVALTLWVYSAIRIVLQLTSLTAFSMFEGATITIVKQYGGDFSLQKISAVLAAIIFAPLAGVMIDLTESFTASFCLYAFLQGLCAVLTLTIDLSFKPPAIKIFGHMKEILSQVEILLFFVAIFICGTAWGYLETFLFWFLQELGGTSLFLGLTVTIGGLTGIPVLIACKALIKRFGHVNILCICIVFYGIRLVGYSYVENPWWCLPYEAMEAFSSSLSTAVAAIYGSLLSNQQTIASVQGIWGGLYFGIGRASGSYFGGLFIKVYGHRRTFQIFAGMCFIGAFLYFLVNKLYIEKYSRPKTNWLDNKQLNPKNFENSELCDAGNSRGDQTIGSSPFCMTEHFANISLEDTPETKVKVRNGQSQPNKAK